jgi:hypothetical protein
MTTQGAHSGQGRAAPETSHVEAQTQVRAAGCNPRPSGNVAELAKAPTPPTPTVAHGHTRAATEGRGRDALDELRTCSPITLRALACELVIKPCAACRAGDDLCDGCAARSALANLCLVLAVLGCAEGGR